MKRCSVEGCENFIFSNHFCTTHQYLRTDDKYMKRKADWAIRKRQTKKINRRSASRKKGEKYYSEVAREMFVDAVKNGTNDCIFCGLKVLDFQGLHHLRGRTNSLLLDKEYFAIVHNECHLFYHRSTHEQRAKESWYDDFLSRIYSIDPELYNKELKKKDKSEPRPLNPRLEFEDEDFL